MPPSPRGDGLLLRLLERPRFPHLDHCRSHNLSTVQQNELPLWHDYTPLSTFDCLLVRIATLDFFFLFHSPIPITSRPLFPPLQLFIHAITDSIQIMDHYKLSSSLQFALLIAIFKNDVTSKKKVLKLATAINTTPSVTDHDISHPSSLNFFFFEVTSFMKIIHVQFLDYSSKPVICYRMVK